MIPSLTIIDNLLPENTALRLRREVLSQEFKDVPYMGGLYQGTNMEFAPPEIPQAISDFFARNIEVKVQAFRSGHEETKLHVNIHADNPISIWASVYYLNLPEDCQGGTAFYQMKETGWHDMPTQKILDESGHDLDWVRDKWVTPEDWNMTDLAAMRFNRLIIYPTKRFHSRFPLQGWGKKESPEHARLVWVSFFDLI